MRAAKRPRIGPAIGRTDPAIPCDRCSAAALELARERALAAQSALKATRSQTLVCDLVAFIMRATRAS